DRVAGEIVQAEIRQPVDLASTACPTGRLAEDDVLVSGENQFDHAREVGSKPGLAGLTLPWRIPARSLHVAEISKLARAGDQHSIHKHSRVALHPEFIGQF